MAARMLLFTDVVDSTLLVERVGDARAADLWALHDRSARDLLASCDGREIDRSDGLFLLFESAQQACRYALAYHVALDGLALAARVGMHFGEVTLRENLPADIARGAKPLEVEGLAKPLAARVMTLAVGGQTLLSEAARRAVGDVASLGAELQSHGHFRLKGIDEPVEVFELGICGQSRFVPPPDSAKAYRVVRVNDLWRPRREVRHTLPAERDSFVGRTDELRALARQLEAGARLLTVLGVGGTGKTRLVVRYGWWWLGDWPGGVFFCDLSEARSLDGVVAAVAVALGVPLLGADITEQLGHAIAGRGRCLMILDNFEQVVDHAAATLGRWLDRCADASFVVTSRERVHLAGEVLFPVEPLPLGREALELFEARARGHVAGFAVDDTNRAAVAEVVRLLDGLPLAIELAAARVRVLSPALLVERLRDRFSLLTGVRGAAARQATLHAAIEWSWNLLNEWEQSALAQCSVFEGPFTLRAAEAVLDLARWPQAPSTMDVVQSLVEKSLLRGWAGRAAGRFEIDEPFFGMYVSIHEYAAARLDAGASEAAQGRHGAYFAGFGTDAAIQALKSHGGTQRWRELALELDDLTSACRRAVRRGDAGVAAATYRAASEVFERQGPFNVAATLGHEVLALQGEADPQRVVVSLRHAIALEQIGSTAAARSCLAQALTLCRRTGQRRLEGQTITQLATLDGRIDGGIAERTQQALVSAVEIARETGNRFGESAALVALARAESDLGRMQQAAVHLRAALVIQRELGNRREEAIALGALAARELDLGDLLAARAHFEAALTLHREAGNRRSASTELVNLGTLHLSQGRIDEAEACYREALENDRAVGARAHEPVVLTSLVLVHDARGDADAALLCCEEALAIAREVARPPLISFALTNLAGLHTQAGRIGEARRALAEAEPIERVSGRLQLGKFLCVRGAADHAAGDVAAAEAALAEAEAIAAEIGAGPGSGLHRAIGQVRQLMGQR